MKDEQFETLVSNIAPENVQAFLRARDTAQREALARVEAERDSLVQLSLERGHQRDAAQVDANELRRERDAAQSQLAEAVGLIRRAQGHDRPRGPISADMEDFLVRHARHAQAEQQEAQDAQAGDERAAFEDEFGRRGFELDRLPSGVYLIPAVRFGWEGWQARAALATQPAAGEPVAWMYDTPKNGRQYSDKRLDHYWWSEMKGDYVKGTPLYVAPPAAAHGGEAVRKDAERYKFLKSEVNTSLMERLDCNYPSSTWDAHIDAAMRAQAGEGGEV